LIIIAGRWRRGRVVALPASVTIVAGITGIAGIPAAGEMAAGAGIYAGTIGAVTDVRFRSLGQRPGQRAGDCCQDQTQDQGDGSQKAYPR